jgi:DNA-binding NarL/FixJ family response regulator
MVRTAIRSMLEEGGLCKVVAEAADGVEAVSRARACDELDLVVMDVGMPRKTGPQATAEILLARPALRVIALTGFADQGSLGAMIAAGAWSYIGKSESAEELRRVVVSAMEGVHYFPPGAAAAMLGMIRAPSSLGGVALTAREFEVLRYTAAGRSVKETATAMRVEESTVRGYRKVLGRKIGVSGTAALRDFYFSHGNYE